MHSQIFLTEKGSMNRRVFYIYVRKLPISLIYRLALSQNTFIIQRRFYVRVSNY